MGPAQHLVDDALLGNTLRQVCWKRLLRLHTSSLTTIFPHSYYYAQMLVHREFVTPARSQILPYFPSLAICCNAARSCAHILDNVRARGRLLDTFFWAPLTAGVSSIILVCV